MKDLLNNLKARLFAKSFDAGTMRRAEYKQNFFHCGDWIYNDIIYYGSRCFVFFVSAHNGSYLVRENARRPNDENIYDTFSSFNDITQELDRMIKSLKRNHLFAVKPFINKYKSTRKSFIKHDR